MASDTLPGARFGAPDDLPYLQTERSPIRLGLARLLAPLASLRLTVALLAMAIFLIFAGTLAQTDKDIWEVMKLYFRTPIAWINFQTFFPAVFFPDGHQPTVPGGFWFPGGFLIGAAMAVNLLAAHGLRFKIQASGSRLAAGLATIAAGIAVTWAVVVLGPDKEEFAAASTVDWSTVWICFKAGLAGLCLLVAYGFWKLEPSRKIERAGLAILECCLAGWLFWIFYYGKDAALSDASMRILWQLIKGGFAGLVLLMGCILVFRKRAGIVLLHAGIGLMMANELIVYALHSEAQMSLYEGDTSNFAQDIRTVELAVVDRSDPKYDDVTVVSKSKLLDSKLADGGIVSADLLPFDVQVVRYVPNSALAHANPKVENPATAGLGVHWNAREVRSSSGTDMDAKVDVPAAYVKFLKKGTAEPLGTYLLTAEMPSQQIDVGGKPYDVSLRFKRSYKPYSVFLYDVRADNFLGTKKTRNYSSDIRLVDPSHNVDRKIKIWMNNPLRFAGDTLYQSGYREDENGEMTTLQVVSNVGWMVPYVGCMIVATGLLAQFSNTLLRFLNRRREEEKKPKPKAKIARVVPMSAVTRFAPLIAVFIAASWLAVDAIPPSTPQGDMNLADFGKLPLVFDGRVKPFDTLARNSLRIISGYETGTDTVYDKDGKVLSSTKYPAIRWLLDLITHSDATLKHQVFRIDNPEVLETLGLKRRPNHLYSAGEFSEKMDEFDKQVDLAGSLEPRKLSTYQRKILELAKKIRTVTVLSAAFDQPRIRADEEHLMNDLLQAVGHQQSLARMEPPLAVPLPAAPLASDDKTRTKAQWEPYTTAWTKAFAQTHVLGQQPNPATLSLNAILVAYQKDQAATFNEELANYRSMLKEQPPVDFNEKKVDFESYFNHFAPFYHGLVLYLAAFVLTVLGWLGWTRPLGRAAFWLIVFTLVLHTAALISRIYISGRPPVTNLYSAAVFIGWGCVVLALVLEVIYRLGIGNVVAGLTGFATLLIAHILSGDGDTFIVLQAVLDTQFWLATHVVCVTMGYATTFIAGTLGTLYILRGVLTPSLSPAIGKELARMIYGALCFALFFSFVGTVLGGLWADDSWGRFWGWDPKENGALMIVLWNALVLHARWGGIVKERGLAMLACVGNVLVGWSMFGVNELGIGLHSYGFTEGVLRNLGIFIVVQLAIVALGCLPRRTWWSAPTLESDA